MAPRDDVGVPLTDRSKRRREMGATLNLPRRPGRWMPRPKSLIAAGGVFVVLAVISGAAVASIPGTNGVISACYDTKTGAVRIIDSSKSTCYKGENPISWNQTGPQGPAGPQGPQGPTG